MTTQGCLQLPVSGAIIEIVEYFLAINQEGQFGVKGQHKQSIEVDITSTDANSSSESSRLHCFKVTQGKLCRWFDVDGFLSSMIPDVLQVIPPELTQEAKTHETYRKGDPANTQGFFITCPHKDNACNQPEHYCVTRDQCGRICTRKSSVPDTSSSSEETSVVLQTMFSPDQIDQVIYDIYQYLYKLRILNLQLNLKLMTCFDEEEQSFQFGEDFHGYKYRTGDLRISTDIGHFFSSNSVPDQVVKIKPSIGSRLVIPSPPLWDDRQVPLKLSVVAAIIPPPACQSDFRNGHCKELWISLFGPGNIPLHIAGKTLFPVDPAQLIRWQDFALTLGDALPAPTNSQDLHTYEADKRYQLSSLEDEDASDPSPRHIIQLFIVLTRNEKNKPLMFQERQDLLHAIRSNMKDYFAENQAKLSLAATSAVNKVLKCTSAESTGQTTSKTRQETVGHAIQHINQAISTIVSYSVHDEFRQTCFRLLQIDNSIDLSKSVQCKLWNVARNRMGVAIPDEFQEASQSQETMTQSQLDSESQSTVTVSAAASTSTYQHPHANNQPGNTHPKEDSGIANLSPRRPFQFSDDDEEPSADDDFANFDVFPDAGEQCLEKVQMESERTDGEGDHLQNESVQSQQILQTAMGDDWFEEVLLNCDWKGKEV